MGRSALASYPVPAASRSSCIECTCTSLDSSLILGWQVGRQAGRQAGKQAGRLGWAGLGCRVPKEGTMYLPAQTLGGRALLTSWSLNEAFRFAPPTPWLIQILVDTGCFDRSMAQNCHAATLDFNCRECRFCGHLQSTIRSPFFPCPY